MPPAGRWPAAVCPARRLVVQPAAGRGSPGTPDSAPPRSWCRTRCASRGAESSCSSGRQTRATAPFAGGAPPRKCRRGALAAGCGPAE
eukprot:8782241-Lingulodinium_polyedra.AAC.1